MSLVAKRKTLFDDRPVEISVRLFSITPALPLTRGLQELTFIIKQDIANINKQIAGLQSYVKQRQSTSSSPETKMVDEHHHNIVMMLQSKLASTSMAFKDVLEIRTQVCSVQILH
jgi:syntaxin 5